MLGKPEKSRSYILLLAPPLATVLMWLAWSTDIVQKLENVTVDLRFTGRAAEDPEPDPRIALIGIGENSLKEIGRWEDWKRNIHGEFLETLAYRPPKVVAFDFFFTEPSDDPEIDLQFSDGLSLHPGAITGMFVDTSEEAKEQATSGTGFPEISLFATKPFPNVTGDTRELLSGPTALTPLEVIAQSSWTGSVNSPPSRIDGMRREIPMIILAQDKVYPSFVLQILMQLEDAHRDDVSIEIGNEITVPKAEGGEWRIPIDEKGFLYLNYRDTERFEVNDYKKIWDYIRITEGRESEWPSTAHHLIDQIVIVGQTATGLSDFGPTPYRAQDALFKVQATALDSILRQDFIKKLSSPAILGIWLAIAWITLFALQKAPISVAIAVPMLITFAVIGLAFFLFERHSILIPLVLPVAGFVLIHTVVIGDRLAAEFREKRHIKNMFRSYVAPELVNQMVATGVMPTLGGEKVEITILFSDIQGFSAFSEELDPVALVELMVEYLSEMTDIVTDAGGTLDKYIGDAIDAMFGAPLPLERHAHIGVMASIQMQRKQAELCARWEKEDRSERVRKMRTRIGINTGYAVVGNIGSKRRFNYTMMGDNVNLGARCESGAKTYGVYTMITGETHDAAKASRDDIVYRYLDRIVVKGRSIPVRVYEVIETRDNVKPDTLECLALYDEALSLYFGRKWNEAREKFEEASHLEPFQPDRDPGITTNPSRVMAARCGIMNTNPPGDDWDGVYRMTTK